MSMQDTIIPQELGEQDRTGFGKGNVGKSTRANVDADAEAAGKCKVARVCERVVVWLTGG